jgi:tetratricopeptide (TPR) repeat protein
MKKVIFPIVISISLFIGQSLGPSGRLFAQTKSEDLNSFYRFPFSIGLSYQALTPLTSYNSDYNIFDIAGEVRYPLPSKPVLQPFFRGGIMRFDSTDVAQPDKWDHTHYYGVLGMGYANRITRNFEMGGDLSAGYSYAVFPEVVDTGKVGSSNLLLEAAGKISLNPSYSVSIDIKPSLKYLLSLSPLKEFNGPLFGLGFYVNYRFGVDPDSARALIRSIKFENAALPPLFSAMQSYYVKNPIGKTVIANSEKVPLTDIEVSFFQAGFMEAATVSSSIPELGAGKKAEVPLLASFNNELFSLEGITPLTGEIIVKYTMKGRPVEQRQPVTYDMYDKTSITWDDDRKVGAFITPADSALKNFASWITRTFKGTASASYNQPVLFAMQAYASLAEIGILYQADAASPFTEAQGNSQLVDSVSLPRETLKRITGDCDDLTVLFCALLESVNIETGFITVPGHIYAAFNTKIPSNEYRDISPDRSLTVVTNGEIWVPVEITMIGKGDFTAAWRRGSELWNGFEQEPDKRKLYRTREAQAVYRPVGLRETDLGLQYGSRENVVKAFNRDYRKLGDAVLSEYLAETKKTDDKKAYNKLGLAYVRFGRYDEAETAFVRATQLDKTFLSAHVNLANIAYIRKNYDQALRMYQDALDSLRKEGKSGTLTYVQILLNVARVYHERENYPQARDTLDQAQKIAPEKVKEYAYLGTGRGGIERAAESGSREMEIFFIQNGQE